MKPLVDYHLHSHFSPDGRSKMEDICRSALAKGLNEIGFSEHLELHPLSLEYGSFVLEPWVQELERCRELYQGRGLIIKSGIEIGEPHLYKDYIADLLSRYEFDYILGSLHTIGDETYFEQSFFEKYGELESFRKYYSELAVLAQEGDFDILAHFDVPARISSALYGQYNPLKYESLIRPVLQICIDRGIAIEINSSGKRLPMSRSIPDREILQWYKEMGGELITFGSDAHHAMNVGQNIEDAYELIDAMGFHGPCIFSKRKILNQPVMKSLEA